MTLEIRAELIYSSVLNKIGIHKYLDNKSDS